MRQGLKELWERLQAKRALGLAAEMAFWVFLSLLPLAAVAGLVTAKFAVGTGTTSLLVSSLPQATQDLINSELGKVAAWNGGKVGISAGLMFVWLAASGVHSIFDGVELESGEPARPWWRKRLMAIAACAVLSVGIFSVALLGVGVGWLFHIIGGATLFEALTLESSALGKILRLVLGGGIWFGLVCALYHVAAPPSARRMTPVMPGAAAAVGLQTLMGLAYGAYVGLSGDGGTYVGGLASIGVTLMGLYLLCVALLVGISVNRVVEERHRERLIAKRDRARDQRSAEPLAAA